MRNSEIKKYYDSYTGRQKNVGVNARHKSILKKSIKAGLTPSSRVLEVGCGIGTFSSLLIDYVKKGSITSIDLSDESIKIAKDIYKNTNIEFIATDATLHNYGNNLYDIIIMPDVIEHIPLEYHFELFKKLSKILKDSGSIFIHIPNPYYLQWCHDNRTDLLQIIDQPIYTKTLIKNTAEHGLFIHKLETYSIWIQEGDYQAITLKKENFKDFNSIPQKEPSIIDKIKYKINNAK